MPLHEEQDSFLDSLATSIDQTECIAHAVVYRRAIVQTPFGCNILKTPWRLRIAQRP